MKKFGMVLSTIILRTSLQSAVFYVDALSGDDTNNGTSPASAWQSIEKVNGLAFSPGDQILFQGGQTFSGNLYLDDSRKGTVLDPVVIGSYGTGRAELQAGNGHGILAYNAGGVVIRDLRITGSGIGQNEGSGIFFYTDLPGRLPVIRVERVEVSGFARNDNAPNAGNAGQGLYVSGWRGDNQAVGFDGIEVIDSVFHGNEMGGMFTWAHRPQGHRNLLVRGSVFHSNPGKLNHANPSGSGLIVSGVDTALVEYCLAYNNGELNNNSAGPVGIWAYDAHRVTIQHNISHSNRTQNGDGGGFDLDGGVTDSVMQYNYSYNNDGAGYLLAQYSGAPAFGNNVVRYNVSQNDGRKKNYGGITLWAAQSNNRVRDVEIYGNTIFVSPSASGIPSGVRMIGNNFLNIKVRNNLFIADGANDVVRVINWDAATATTATDHVLFQGNAYHHRNRASARFYYGTGYDGLDAWRAASGQEKNLAGDPTGLETDPRFLQNDLAPLLTDPLHLASIPAYRLSAASPLRGAGVPLDGLDPGGRDFFGTPLPETGPMDIGAHQFRSLWGYEQFAQGLDWQGADASPDVKINDNTLSNFAIYALGGNPLSPDAPVEMPYAEADSDFLELHFQRVADPNLVYEVYGGEDLTALQSEWQSTGLQNQSGPVSVRKTFENETRYFLHLKILRP